MILKKKVTQDGQADERDTETLLSIIDTGEEAEEEGGRRLRAQLLVTRYILPSIFQ